jgi:hypothetical protein
MRRAYLLVVLVLCQGFSGLVFAQEKYGYEIGAYAGPTYWQARDFQVNAPQVLPPLNVRLHYDDKIDYGVRFNLLSRGLWGGELDYNFQRNTVTLTNESSASVALKGNVQHFFYNTIFYPLHYSERHVSPFLTAGIGLAAYRLDKEARARAADPRIYALGRLEDLDKRFAFNYGGGVKAIIAPHFGVRVDFRHNFSDVPSYGLPKESADPTQIVLPIQGKLQNYEVTAGVYFHVLK